MASQPKKKQSFRLWLPWKASKSKRTKTPPEAPSKSSIEVEQEPSPQRASQPKPISPSLSPISSPSQRIAAGQVPQSQEQPRSPSPRRLSPVSSPSPPRSKEEEDTTPVSSPSPRRDAGQVPQRQEQPQPPSPPRSKEEDPTPVSSPSQRRAAGQVPQRQEQPQLPSPRRLSPVSSPSPPRLKEKDPTPTAAVASPTQSEAAPQQEPPALTQEVSQSPLLLPAEKPEKTVESESESPTHQKEILSHASQPTQDLKQGQPDSNSVGTRSQYTQDSELKSKALAPTNGTISEESPLIEHETESMQEKTQVNSETIGSTHPSQFPEIQETEIKPKEVTKPSELKQADEESEKVADQQTPVEERPKVSLESITENLDVAKDRNPISPQPNIIDEANKEERQKVDPEPHQPATVKPPANQVLSDKPTADSREEENKMSLREQERITLIPVIPHVSPISGDNFQKENGERSNLVQKINIRHTQHVGSEQELSIITLAGENNGASMNIRREMLNETGFWRGYKIDDHPSAEKNGKNKALAEKSSQIDEALPLAISINSNVQSINNSVLHESSCSEEDPGVYLNYSSKPTKTAD